MDIFFKKVYQMVEANNQLFTEAELPTVKTIDKYRGQTTNPERFEFFEIPAIFIATSIDWRREGKIYRGACDIDFHVVLENPWGTGNTFTGYEEALKKSHYYLFCHAIFDGLESDTTSKLERVSDRDIDTGVIAYNILKYRCEYYGSNFNAGEYQEVDDAILDLINRKLVKKLSK